MMLLNNVVIVSQIPCETPLRSLASVYAVTAASMLNNVMLAAVTYGFSPQLWVDVYGVILRTRLGV